MKIFILSLFFYFVFTDSLFIQTTYGPINGKYGPNNIREFLGIPYAAPPINNLRWATTQPPIPWDSPLNCTNYGLSCPQLLSPLFKNEFNEQFENSSEDCLTMNIWTPPDTNPLVLLPVMVFVYGGGFQTGSSDDLMIYGGNLAYFENVIVVNFNYRVGCLGFLAIPNIDDINPAYPTNGNWGFFDQQMALNFIKQNIIQFGGNPNQVMLFGESAGGNSMFDHIASPLSAGLFQSIGIESGYYHGLIPLEDAEDMGEYTVNILGCSNLTATDTLECLRHVSIDDILNLTSSCFYMPTIDGIQFTQQPNDAVLSGNFNRVPVLLGANHNELAIFAVTGVPQNMTSSEYNKWFTLLWNAFDLPKDQKQNAMNLYPLDEFPKPFWALVAAFTDWNFKCSNRRFAKFLQQELIDTYLFQFSTPPDNTGYWNYDEFLGVYHTAELQYVFRTYNNFSIIQGEDISNIIMKYWSLFAKKGNPNNPNLPFWSSYDISTDKNMNIGKNLGLQVGMGNATRCDFWDTLPDYTSGATCSINNKNKNNLYNILMNINNL